MRTTMKTLKLSLFYCALLAAWLPAARAAFTFSISPSVVSNTYSGYLTLLVTGLTNNAETVVVQKFLDANGNGVIDAGDPLWQQFNLTDGTNFQIGGVTNINVPGDLDSTPGQITARISFLGNQSQRISGNYLLKVSDPSGFTVTNSFMVTNFPFPQQFTGTVSSNGVALPGAGVILFQLSGSDLNAVGGEVADNSGGFAIPAPPGTYALAAFANNTVANIAAAAYLVLSNGITFNTNLSVIPGTTTISGAMQVAAHPSQGLPGILVTVQTKNYLLGVGHSDTNGDFTVGVPANQWKVDIDSATVAALGYVVPQVKITEDTTTGPVSGVPVNLTQGTALFYGTVKDNFGNPLPGAVDVGANDNFSGLFQSDGYTDANGNFVVAVVGGLGTNDPWWVQVENASAFPTYVFSQPQFNTFNGTNIGVGQAVPASMLALLATNQITGHVQTSAGRPIGNEGVSLFASTNGYNFNSYVDTDTNGNFTFAVGPGNWFLNLNTQNGSDSLNTNLGAGTYQSPAGINVVITNKNGTANFTVEPCGGVLIFTTNLPDAQVGFYYNIQLQGSTCTGMENWSVNDPQDLPPNLSLGVNGQLQGTPTNSGTYHFTVQVNDNEGNNAHQNLTLVITTSTFPLQVTTTSLPNATVGIFYNQPLQFSGGQPPAHWSLSPGSAALPANLTLSTNGLLSGTPATNGTYNFFARVTDSANSTADQPLSLVVNNQALALQITSTLLSNATQNAFYSTHLVANGGQPPYSWSLSPGSANPPAGLSLATNGVLAGTPIASGASEFIVEVTDAASDWTYAVLSLTVTPSSLPQVIKLTVPDQTIAGSFQFSFKAAANVTYTIQSSKNLQTWANYEAFTFTNSAPAGQTWTVAIPNPSGVSQSFYRVKVGP